MTAAVYDDGPSLNEVLGPRPWAGKQPLYLPLAKAAPGAATAAPAHRYQPRNMTWEERHRLQREEEAGVDDVRDPHKRLRQLVPTDKAPHELMHQELVDHYGRHNMQHRYQLSTTGDETADERNHRISRNLTATVALPPADRDDYKKEIRHQRRELGLPALRDYPEQKLFHGAAGVNRHRELVAQALREGKDVPKKVLREMPSTIIPGKQEAYQARQWHKLTRKDVVDFKVQEAHDQGMRGFRRHDAEENIADWHQKKVLAAMKAGRGAEVPDDVLQDHQDREGHAPAIDRELVRRAAAREKVQVAAKAARVDGRTRAGRVAAGRKGRMIGGVDVVAKRGPATRDEKAARAKVKIAQQAEAAKKFGTGALDPVASARRVRAEAQQNAAAKVAAARAGMRTAVASATKPPPKVAPKSPPTPPRVGPKTTPVAAGPRPTAKVAPPPAAPKSLRQGVRVLVNHPDTGEYVGHLGAKTSKGYPVTNAGAKIGPHIHRPEEMVPLPEHPAGGAPVGRRYRAGSRVVTADHLGGYVGTVANAGEKNGMPHYRVTPTNKAFGRPRTIAHKDLLPAPDAPRIAAPRPAPVAKPVAAAPAPRRAAGMASSPAVRAGAARAKATVAAVGGGKV